MQGVLFETGSTGDLAAFYRERFRPLKAGNRPATLLTYDNTVRLFTALVGSVPLRSIDLETIVRFRNRLWDPARYPPPVGAKRPKAHKPGSVNKELRNLRAMLRVAKKMGLIDSVPPIDRDVFLREPKRLPRPVGGDLLERIWAAAEQAVYPRLRELPAADWWRSIILAAVTTGYRRGPLLALRWEWIDLARGAIAVPAEDDKAGRDRLKPLHPELRKWLLRIRTADPHVWPWPHNIRLFTRQWHKLQSVAGIPKKEHTTFHRLKSTCLTWSSQVASPPVTQYLGDHASYKTTIQYYAAPAGIEDAVGRLPVPEYMTPGGDDPPDAMRLFAG